MVKSAAMADREAARGEEMSVLRPELGCAVLKDPFPYLVNESVFDADLYRRLERDFPAGEMFFRHMNEVENNQAVRIGAAEVIGNPAFSAE